MNENLQAEGFLDCMTEEIGKVMRADKKKPNGQCEPLQDGKPENIPDNISLDDFYAYMPMHNYIYIPTRSTWPGGSINSRIPHVEVKGRHGKIEKIKPSTWLDQNKPVVQMVWVPGLPLAPKGRVLIEGGWIDQSDAVVFNLYHPPAAVLGDPTKADIWINHINYVYPDDAEHIIDWLAQRVQNPQVKINHALVLGGEQGIGKDTILEPVKHAVGPWNFQETSPPQITGRFNGFLKSVILRISEARDLGEWDRFSFYEHTKVYIAAPPDTLRIDEKNLREYSIVNCCGVVITTNHKTDGIYLPADDRRHYVAWSEIKMDDPRFQNGYWNQIWNFYENGGISHVVAYLMQRDISKFDPKAPPPKTPAFWAIADANRPPEEPELADLLDTLGKPDAVTVDKLHRQAGGTFAEWLGDRKNRRIIPHRLEKCGYVPVRNPDSKDGVWKIRSKRQTVYAKADLPLRDQIESVKKL